MEWARIDRLKGESMFDSYLDIVLVKKHAISDRILELILPF